MNKINLSGLNQINTNQNGNNVPNNKSNNPENENQEEIDIKALNEDYSLKDSERKKIISDYYSKHLSEVIPNFLYISSYNATKNKSLLEKNKITHIINCAADFCENVFESENKYTYLSFYLKDHVLENIECIFYECIKFIQHSFFGYLTSIFSNICNSTVTIMMAIPKEIANTTAYTNPSETVF